MTSSAKVDRAELETKVQDMYRAVALHPEGEFHFEMGRALAERLGYSPEDLDRVPPEAIESFAGVGYYFHLADLKEGESVLDLGSGSGMDTFVAALKVGLSGRVIGVDMTDEQRLKAERLRDRSGMRNVTYLKSHIESLPCADASVDAVISNGVIDLDRRAAAEGRATSRPERNAQRNLPQEPYRIASLRGRVRRRGDQQRCHQSVGGQAQGISGSGPRSQARRPSRALRHRHRSAATGRNRLQHHAVGRLHRRGDAAGRLPFGDRGSGIQDPGGGGQ